jgi:hypothetical protein
MNDVKDLLSRALHDGPVAELADHPAMDPSADLRRGQARLRRRRTAGFAGAAAVALGIGVVPLALGNAGETSGAEADPVVAQAPAPTLTTLSMVKLAAYTGKQVPGYTVAWSPKGWVIESSDASTLVIAEAGVKARRDFGGKIVISLLSRDAKPPTSGGTVQRVDGRPGRLFDDEVDLTPAQKAEQAKIAEVKAAAARKAGSTDQKPFPPTMALYYEYKDGRWMAVQTPKSLGWGGAEIAKFASGIKVTDGAVANPG